MRDHDRQARPGHAVQEDGGRGGVIQHLDHADAGLVLLALVGDEGGPGARAGNERLDAAEELAAVADAEGEGVGAVEKIAEFLARGLVPQDAVGPALAGAEDVAVAEAAAGGEPDD